MDARAPRWLRGQDSPDMIQSFRWKILPLIFLCVLFPHPPLLIADTIPHKQDPPLVVMNARYHMPEAGEVIFVWGINGWRPIDKEMRPPGTTVDRRLMYSPMVHVDNTFTIKIQVPSGATVDYVFLIKKNRAGSAVDIYDTNGKRDYHSVAAEGVVAEVKGRTLSELTDPKVKIGIWLYLATGIFFVLAVAGISRYAALLKKRNIPENRTVGVICTSICLFCSLVFIRAYILKFDWNSLGSFFQLVPRMILTAYHDLIYVAIITMLFLVLHALIGDNKKVLGGLGIGFTVLALFSLLFSLANIRIVTTLGKPFSYQYLYYSDFLKSVEVQKAVSYNMSIDILFIAIGVCGVVVIMSRYFSMTTSYILFRVGATKLMIVPFIVILPAYILFAKGYVSKNGWDAARLENPVSYFVMSYLSSYDNPALFTMKTSIGFEDFRGDSYGKTIKEKRKSKLVRIKNVIIMVLESVPAEYLDVYGGRYHVTPVLDQYRGKSLLFENIYGHAPSTNKAMFSLLSSAYPWISYKSITQEYPAVDVRTISKEFKDRGYRTAFFNSGDTRFQGGDKYLAHCGFDFVEDVRTRDCDQPKFIASTKEWSYQDSSDDGCTALSLANWITSAPEQPFFAVMWTNMTHYPYFVSGKEIDFGVEDDAFNRYLNALHHGDRALGHLMRTLEAEGLEESTLVVVLGDHGEAFGRHNQYTHASKIYEENLHIPLILINGRLYHRQESPVIGGLVDVAPTIMDLMDLPTPAAWEGRSLFSEDRNPRVYFFAPWSDFLFGYRDGNLKIIFDAMRNEYEIYDLSKDPNETSNLVDRFPGVREEAVHRLAAWVQFQDRYMKRLVGSTKE